jgi:exodeoxyribonuclease V alpha subunit
LDGGTTMNTVTFDCQLERCLFQKDGYYIYAMKIDRFKYPDIVVGKWGTTTILGNNLYELEPKQTYHVTAEPKDTKYGVSYEVVSITFDQPQTEEDIRNYLMTVLTKNQAEQIMKHYPNIMDLVAQDRVDEIDISKLKYINQSSLNNIIVKIRATSLLVDICAMFYNTITLNVMQKLYGKFGSVDKIKEVLREQPYSGLCKLEGVGFRKADEILLSIEEESNAIKSRGEEPRFEFKGPLKFSEDRCLACMQYYLDENEQDGNTKMKIEDLKAKVYTYAKETSIFFDKLLDNDIFFVDKINGVIGNKSTYDIEKYIAETLLNANKSPILWDFDLEKYKTLGEFKLTEQQRAVQELLCNNNVVVLNGPAGSGKTSSVKSLIKMLNDNKLDFVMSCPSAKAAKVLEKYAGFPATTIHRMLGYQDGGFIHCKTNPLQADLVIIDESSMLDIFLAKSVLDAIDFQKTKLLLIGDSYQLSSVGAGNLLHDIINSNVCPISTLNEIFRYSEGGLVAVATDTRNGKQFLPYIISPGTQVIPKGNSFFFCPQSKETCVDYAVKMYLKLAETNPLEDTIVITSQNKGLQGAIEINNRIQNAVNPKKDDNVLQLVREDYIIEYRQNDMVMQTVNDYHSIICDEHGYYELDDGGEPMYQTLIANGETGRIVYVCGQKMVVKFDNYYILRNKSDLDKMSLAYAITAHKSQGSGYKNVIVVTPSTHTYMLNSNLLYVAYTRSREKCFNIGNPKTIAVAIKKKQNLSRETFLQDIIKKIRSIESES